ncbi:MAG: DUF4157 domain-containing protein [Deltaproteobacteria bacterium]|nr:DUF4157 domain-containing protein [Deltaproteobacteria bacterium]
MRKPDHAIASGLLQRAARDANGVADGAESAVAAASSSSGSALPDNLMRKFESSLGADLSGVRVHTGEASAAANDAVGAKAYTMGNDIHFGAGQYDPSSPGGEHLLAHEVAHTVQQAGGAQRMQFKLAVSSPGDSLEHEADRAADAMVTGAPAQVSGSSGLARVIQREAKADKAGAPAKLSGIDIPLVETASPKFALGPFDGTAKIGGKVSLKPQGAAASGAAEVKVGADKDKLKLSAEKEFGAETWTFKPKLVSEAELDVNGKPKVNVGVAIEHPGHKFENVKAGPYTVTATAFEWKKGAKPVIGKFGTDVSLSATTTKPYYGHNVSAAFKGALEIEPNWAKIGQWIGQRVATTISSSAALVAAAVVAPVATMGAMLVAWSKAGHEFDAVQARIQNLRDHCRIAATEALTGEHIAVPIGGKDMNAGATTLANDIRSALAAQLNIPEGAFAEAAKAKPSLPGMVYAAAWGKAWPALKAQLLQNYKDTFWTSYKFERQWLDSFDTGDFSKG